MDVNDNIIVVNDKPNQVDEGISPELLDIVEHGVDASDEDVDTWIIRMVNQIINFWD